MKKWIFLFIIQATSSAFALDHLSFSQVWKMISKDSKAQKAAKLETQASEEALNRASKHWLPRVYVQARTYQTNDPAQSFIGVLEQRSLQASDFNPDAINHPDRQTYTQGVLGVDWPLYEGGMKVNQVKAQTHLHAASEKESSSVQLEQYSQVAKAYASLSVLQQEKQKLMEISQHVQKLLKSYQLGSRGNPVGYSGLLGLQSLDNRLQGMIKSYEAQIRSQFLALQELGVSQPAWTPVFDDPVRFVETYLNSQSEEASVKQEAFREKSKAMNDMANMEKARYLPRIGAFAEAATFHGDRDTASNTMAGLYLQWNLWSPDDSGALKEAQLKSLAATTAADAFAQKERIEQQALNQSLQSLKDNLQLLNQSQEFLNEQTKVTENLFKNGSINALQFVEVLNRRAELVASHSEASLQLIDSASQKILKTNFEYPQSIVSGE